jgi:ketosteroid isomerase-like protein
MKGPSRDGEAGAEHNIEIVRRLYEAWSRREIPGPPELLHADVEYVNPDGAVEPGTRRGRDEFARAVAKVFESWEEWEMTPVSFKAREDRVAVVVSYRARGAASGAEVAGEESALLTLRDGRLARYEWFHSPEDAASALGRPG